MIMLAGVPGSGKSFHTQKELADADVVLSRDELGGLIKDLVPKAEMAISQGAKKIVLDCTFLTKESREPFTALAAKTGTPLHVVFLDATKVVSQFNICWRMLQRCGKILRTKEDYKDFKSETWALPPAAMFAMFKKLEKPQQTEGFASVRVIKPGPWKLPTKFKNAAVILDYDGTVRDTKTGAKYPQHPDDVVAFPQAATKLQALAKDGMLLLGASNQSGVAKNKPPMKLAIACFDETNRQLGVDIPVDFDYSPAGPAAGWYRKPFPAMGLTAVWEHKLDPTKVTMVGDRTSDKTFATRCGFNFEYAKDFFDL